MDVSETVRKHYGRSGLVETVLDAVVATGADPDRLTLADLGSVDQLHMGGAVGTRALLERLGLSPGTRLLEVGCGLGGVARAAAGGFGCPVVGVDLSPAFVEAGQALTARVGLADLVTLQVVAADALGFEGRSFDRAVLVHVGMNLPDKAAVFAEVRRVLRPGAVFAIFDQMRGGPGPLSYPLPWADDASTSFVAEPDGYVELLAAAGFRVDVVEDWTRTVLPAGPPGPGAALSPATVFGPDFAARFQNNVAAARAGTLASVVILAHVPDQTTSGSSDSSRRDPARA